MFKLYRHFSKPVVRLSVLIAFLCVVVGFCCYMVQSDREEEESNRFRIAWWSVNRGETADVRTMLQRKEIGSEDLSEMLLMAAGEDDMDAEQAVKTLLALRVNSRAKDGFGQTALQLARFHHHAGIILLLQQAGAKE